MLYNVVKKNDIIYHPRLEWWRNAVPVKLRTADLGPDSNKVWKEGRKQRCFFMGAGVAAADLHARSALRIQFANFVSDGLGEQSGSSLLFVSQYTRLSSYVCCSCSSSSFGTVMTMLMISAFHPRPSNLHPPLLHVQIQPHPRTKHQFMHCQNIILWWSELIIF